MSKKKAIIAFDVETSGLSASNEQIYTAYFSMIEADTGKKIKSLDLAIGQRPDTLPSPQAVKANRINPMTHKGMFESEAAGAIEDFISSASLDHEVTMMAHNIQFDVKFLRSLLSRNGYSAKSVPLRQLDVMDLAKSQIYNKKIDRSKFIGVTNAAGQTRPSLSQVSLAACLGVEADSSKNHSAKYDVEVMVSNWERMGKPSLDDIKTESTDPYFLQKELVNRVVTTKEYNNISGEIESKKYLVTGIGAGKPDLSAPGRLAHSTILISLSDDSVVADLKKRMEKQAGENEAVRGGMVSSAIKAGCKLRGYNSSKWLDYEAADATSSELRYAAELMPFLEKHVKTSRENERAEEINKILSGFSEDEHYDLAAPDDETFFVGSHEHLIPAIAKDISSLSRKERLAYISQVANSQQPPVGKLWAHTALATSERYGYRNGLDGFAKKRDQDLSDRVPENFEEKHHEVGLDLIKAPLQKKLNAMGITGVTYRNTGTSVVVEAVKDSGEKNELGVIAFEYDRKGLLTAPRVDRITEVLTSALGVTKTDAAELRKGLKISPDNSSYPAYLRLFRKLADEQDPADGDYLKGIYAELPKDYDELRRRLGASAINSATSTVGSHFHKNRSLGSLVKLIESAETLASGARKAYASIETGDSYTANAIDEALINTEANPYNQQRQQIDSIVKDKKISLFAAAAASKSGDLEQSEGQPSPIEAGVVKSRCKVCNRQADEKKQIAGMGRTCARKLNAWIHQPEITSSDISNRKYKKVSDLKARDGRYPIMIVKDIRTGAEFAADVVQKESDGRYLVINLSEVAREKSGKVNKLGLSETARVYLEPDNHLVRSIYGSSSKQSFN